MYIVTLEILCLPLGTIAGITQIKAKAYYNRRHCITPMQILLCIIFGYQCYYTLWAGGTHFGSALIQGSGSTRGRTVHHTLKAAMRETTSTIGPSGRVPRSPLGALRLRLCIHIHGTYSITCHNRCTWLYQAHWISSQYFWKARIKHKNFARYRCHKEA